MTNITMQRTSKRNRSTTSSAKLAALFLTTLFALFCITTILLGLFVHNLDRGLLPSSDTATGKNNISPHDDRCAILFFGVPRRLKDIGYTAIKLYILDANPQCDVFVHTYNVTKVVGSRAGEDGDGSIDINDVYLLLGKHKEGSNHLVMDTDEQFKEQYDLEHYRKLIPTPSAWKPDSMDNMIRQWHSIERVWNLMRVKENKSNWQYNRIGLFRPDVLYTHPISITNPIEKAVIPKMMYKQTKWGGINDRMFYGTREFASIWATERFSTVDSYLSYQKSNPDYASKRGLHSEDFLRYLMTKKHDVPLMMKPICFKRIRSSGMIMHSDCSLEPRVIIHNRWDAKPGGAEALLQLTLAFHSWMPNQTYAQGRTDARIIKDHWLDWYPEINRLNVVHEQKLRVDIADKKVFRKGDIYIIPELFNCPKHLVEMGVHVFIWKLGAVGNHGSFSGQKNNMQLGCKYLSHSHWLANAEELEIPEERIFLPYMTPAKSQKGDITNVRRENLIIVNGHDPSSPDGETVKNYCDGKDCKVTILKGFNTKQLLDLYQRAKIVVGFCMRGCERAPIEAVLAGVVLVSNNCLAGQDRHDFPIPRENIVAANNTVEDVFGRILANFEEEQNKMGNMRALYQMIGPDTLAKQTQGFIHNFFWGMAGHNSTASLG